MSDSEAKWYILHTYSGYENKVAEDIKKLVKNRNLENLIEDVIIPTVKKIVEKDNGKQVEVEEKLYPGYVFVKMVHTDESWYICRNTRGVTGFVGPDSKEPSPLSEEEARDLERGREPVAVSFEVGDRVAIRQGVLGGLSGNIIEIDNERQTAVVNLESIFGDVTPTNVEFSAIKKV